MKGLRDKTINGVKWSSIGTIVDNVIGFVVFIILARLLEPADFGLVALASTIVHFMGPYVSLGLGPAVVQRADLTTEHLNSAFWANVGLGVSMSLATYFGAPYIASFFGAPELAEVVQWLSISFLFLALTSIQSSLVRRKMNFKVLAIRSIVAMACGGVVGIVMAFMGFGVWSLVARQLVQSGVAVLLLWGISSWRPSLNFSLGHFWELAKFGLHVTGAELMVMLNRRSDNLLIGYFLGPVMLGYYTVAYRLLIILFQVISKTIYQVGMPAFARMQDDKTRVTKAYYDMSRVTAFISLPIFLGASATAIELVPLLYGDKWAPSIPVMQILLLVGVVHCLLRPVTAVIIGLGRPDWRLRVQIIDGIANVIGFVIAVQWGIVAVAASYAIVGYLQTPLWYMTLRRMIPVKLGEYMSLMKGVVAATLAMLIAIFAARHIMLGYEIGDAVRGVILVLVGGLVYSAIIWKIDPQATHQVIELGRRVMSRSRRSES